MAGTFANGSKWYIDKWTNTAVINLTGINPSGRTADTLDVSDHESPDAYREFIQGMRDGGELSFEGNYDLTEVGKVVAALEAGGVQATAVHFPTDPLTIIELDGIITEASGIDAPFDDKISFAGTMKITGKPILGIKGTFSIGAITAPGDPAPISATTGFSNDLQTTGGYLGSAYNRGI